VASQALAFWWLKEGEEEVVRVCGEASAVLRAVAADEARFVRTTAQLDRMTLRWKQPAVGVKLTSQLQLVLSIRPLRHGTILHLLQRNSFPALPKKKKVVGLERGPLSLVSTIEELLDRKVAAPV
jgi:hypothetical protein